MKIVKIEVATELCPLRVPFKTALRTAYEIENILVKVHTENGLVGIGATVPTWVITGDSKESIIAALQGPITNALLNQDARNLNALLLKIQKSCINNSSAKAAIDIALHDLFAKWLNQPLYAVLGGHKPLTTCMTIGLDDPNVMKNAAMDAVEKGFSALKIKVGNAPDKDIERISTIVDAIPAHIRLRLDANQGWKAKDAIRVIHELERLAFNIDWVEQPVHAKDFEGMKYVTDHVNMKIMADESVFSPQDAFALLKDRCVDLLNIKLLKCGGIGEAIKIADLGALYGVECMIGSMMESSISVTAAAHFAASHPNVLYCDFDAPLWLTESPRGIIYQGEDVKLPDAMGLGVVI